jgi:hypothetical protein
MTLEMNDLQVIKMNNEQASRIFRRKNLNHQTYDLASQSLNNVGFQRAAAIQIDLTKEHVQARCREDVLKLSGQPDDPLALRVLQEQLRVWASQEKQAALCINCSSDADHATLKAVLAACREAGIRKIELRTPRRD